MHITVCVCTRDRGAAIYDTLASLAGSSFGDFDLVVVDQSLDVDTERVVSAFAQLDARVSYHRSTSVGLSAARNVAIKLAQGPVIAFTDDDCVVDTHWLEAIERGFTQHPGVGLICGEVRAAPHDAERGFVPDFIIRQPLEVRSPRQKWRCRGIGANMAFRLSALRSIGSFDELLGAGAPLCAAEDYDVTYRMLKAGFTVLAAPDAIVTHYGFRDWPAASRLMRQSGYGAGAAYMKHLRLGDLAVLPTLLHDCLSVVSWPRLLRLERGSGLAYCVAYVRGAVASWRYTIERRTRLFVVPASAPAAIMSDVSPVEQVTEHA
jgi:glycosyltransferase involved in cell wall biosynthesis